MVLHVYAELWSPQPPPQSMVAVAKAFCRSLLWGRETAPLSRTELAIYGFGAAFTAYGLSIVAKPAYRVARQALGWRPPAKMDVSLANVTNHGSRAESRYAGSAETNMSMADGQVAVGHYGDNQFRVSGSGWRLDLGPTECLITPCHVWEEVLARAGDRVTLRGKTRDLEVKDSDVVRQEIFTDVLLIQLPPNTFARLGVSKASIVSIDKKASAKIAGPVGMGTMGYLSLSDRAFGMTHYEGTTLPGYSGAPYTVAGKIAAMHLRGSDTQNGPNIGVSAQIIYVTAKKVLNLNLEDSEEWLIDQVTKRKRRIFIDNSWNHPDSYRVRIGNQFAIIDREVMGQALGESLDEYVDFIDFDPTGPKESTGSGNLMTPGALPSLAEPQGSGPLDHQLLISEGLNAWLESLDHLSTTELRKILSKSNQLYQKRCHASTTTSGQTKPATI